MEREQVGTAWEAEPGDWIVIKSANPKAKPENPRIGKGYHYFDIVLGLGTSRQANNPSILVYFHGSISGNTIIKKVGSEFDRG